MTLKQMEQIKRLFKNNLFNLVLLFILALAIRLPLYHSPFWRTDDAIQYINVARNLTSGQGFIQNIKADYSTSDPVITSSFRGRTSLISLFLAGILFIGGDEYSMQLFCFFIGIINCCLVYILCRRWVSPDWSFIAGLLAALNPNLLINNRLILTEPLFTMFILLVFISLYYIKEKYSKYVITGGLVSLAYLTRTEGILLLPVILITEVKPPKKIVKTILLIGAFCVISSPYFFGNFVNTGNPFYSLHQRLYMVRDYREYVNGNGYGITFPPPLSFITNNIFWIVKQEIVVFRDNINSLVYFDWFGPLLIFLLLVFLPTTWKKFKNFHLYAFIIILVYTSAWSALFERSRHFTATFLLLLIPLAYAFEQLSKKNIKTVIVILFCVLFPYLLLDVHRIIYARTIDTLPAERWGPLLRGKEFSWIEKNTDKKDIISSTNPEMVYLFTDRSGINTPNLLNKNNYLSYIHQYDIKYFLIDNPKGDKLLSKVAKLKVTMPHSTIYEVSK